MSWQATMWMFGAGFFFGIATPLLVWIIWLRAKDRNLEKQLRDSKLEVEFEKIKNLRDSMDIPALVRDRNEQNERGDT